MFTLKWMLINDPRGKKTLPLKLQDPKENITSGSKRPAKSFVVVRYYTLDIQKHFADKRWLGIYLKMVQRSI